MRKFTLGITLTAFLLLTGWNAIAQTPAIENLSISASSLSNLTNDDLESSYGTNGTVIETAEAWFVNGSPVNTLYLPFEGGSSNALLDFSGSNNHATLSADASQQPSWESNLGYNSNGAFLFDGNDYLEVEDALPLNASYTKTAWIYGAGTSSGFRNIMSSDFFNENNHFLKIDPDGILNAGHTFGSRVVESPDSLLLDVWYFVAVSFNYESGEMVLYLDGEEISRSTVPEQYRSVADPTVLIGSMNYVSHFEGRIDEPRIFDRALSGLQIEYMYNEGNGENGILKASETRGDDTWHVEVTPFSVDEVGSTVVSNTIAIVGTVVDGLILEASSTDNLTIDDLAVSYSVNEAVVETAVAWYKNGDPDAVLYLPFEGGPDNALLDFSGNGNHGSFTTILESSIPEWRPAAGIDGSGAYFFDGFQDHVDAGEIMPLNSDYTKTAWIRVYGDNTGFRNIISSDLYGPNNHYLKLDDSGHLTAGQNTGILSVWDTTAVSAQEWYLVGVTFEYETGEMILYKNGTVVSRAILPVEERSIADPSVLIGAMNYTVSWLGIIDEPSIYDHIISPEQMQALYNSGRQALLSEETRGSDVWHAEVTPFANYELGATLTSNSLTIHSTVVSEIFDQTISEGASFSTFDLDDHVTDYEYSDQDITWATHGESDLAVTIDGNNVATVSIPDENWFGSESIYFVAANPYGDADSTQVTFTVVSVNDPPDTILLSNNNIDERVVLGTSVGLFSTSDVDTGDTHTYTFATDGGVYDVGNGAFIIDGDTLKTNVEIDYEVQDTFSILVQADDGNGGLKTVNFTIYVNDVDETSVQDFYNHPEFKVYPVPAVDFVTVEVNNPENRELLLEIYYATGAVVHSESIFDKKVVDLSGFEEGMYILRLSGEKVYGTRKLIVRDR